MMQDSQALLDNSTSITSTNKERPIGFTNHERKRKLSIYISPAHKSKTICDDNDNESSDEDEGSKTAHKKRKVFQQTSKRSGACSMPTSLFPSDLEWQNRNVHLYNNRASLPHNLKIPEIRIIPSSPSLDPNDPDYPEFYEEKLYIESKNSSCSSSEIKSEENKNLSSSNDNNSAAVSNPKFIIDNNNEKNLSDKIDDTVEISNNEANRLVCDKTTISEEESTPSLDIILAKSESEEERKNCLNFARKCLKRKISDV